MQKGAFDGVACKYLLLATFAAKGFFGKHRSHVDFPFCTMLESNYFLYCELSRLTHGVVEQMRILFLDASPP